MAGSMAISQVSRNDTAAAKLARLLTRDRDFVRVTLLLGAVTVDTAAITLAAVTASLIRPDPGEFGGTTTVIAAIAPTYILACIALGAYRLSVLKHASRAAVKALYALLIAAVCAASAAFAFHAGAAFSRLESGIVLIAFGAYVVASRPLGARILQRLGKVISTKVIVLADQPRLNKDHSDVLTLYLPVPNLSDHASLDSLFRAVSPVDRVILRINDPEERQHWIRVMQLLNVDAELVEPSLNRIVPIGLGEWEGAPTLVVARGPLKLHERMLKRSFDLACVLLSLPFLLPVLLALMLMVRIDSPGPALFVQERLGLKNRPYRCNKLRTMWHDLGDGTGRNSASRGDRRVTRLGRFLRSTSLDELPQILNVLKGEMSLVGPRPHALGSTAGGALFWEVTPQYWTRHSMKPGLTGLAQVQGLRGATQTRQDLERRVAADLDYINRWSLWLDMQILARTVLVLVHRNAY